jgi:hypothetical protein
MTTENLDILSKIAKITIAHVPQWVAVHYPDLVGQEIEAFESGTITVAVRIGQSIVIKIFVPKYDWITDYDEYSPKMIQNYINLVQSDLNLADFSVLDFIVHDDIFDAPVVVVKYLPNTRSLVSEFYQYSSEQKQASISNIITKLKDFNQKIVGEYSTQRLIYEFDRQMKRHGDKLPTTQYKVFTQLRKMITPRVVSDIFLVHNDIHMENILVDEGGDLHLIDFDFCHFAPIFTELGVVFLFCFIPTAVVPENLEMHYRHSMPEVFDSFLAQYPALYDLEFENEIRLLFASQLIQKLVHPKFSVLANQAYHRFF